MKRSRRTVTAAALACAALTLVAVTAAAHTAKYDSKATLHLRLEQNGPSKWSGKVISGKHRCEAHRQVELKQVRKGGDGGVATKFTDRDGRWRVLQRPTPGKRYYVRAKRKEWRSSGQRHVCKGAVSKKVTVPSS